MLKKVINTTSLPVISAIVSKTDVKKATEELKRKIETCLPLF